uniref:LAGLIDADG homing endonuclease n=1 Tax=Romanomermis culicivorax TaxID=13658 RepID=A0A915IGV6_ROMCU
MANKITFDLKYFYIYLKTYGYYTAGKTGFKVDGIYTTTAAKLALLELLSSFLDDEEWSFFYGVKKI